MTLDLTRSRFSARLLRPSTLGQGDAWAFVVLPPEASNKLPRRGRTSATGTLNGCGFTALLEPDGRKGHWLRIDAALLEKSGARIGASADFEIAAMAQELEPEVPQDLAAALEATPKSRKTWNATTTVARIDWIHWITSAKQARTRAKRIRNACDMLAVGEKRVCCFDPSGYYSKAFGAPQAEE